MSAMRFAPGLAFLLVPLAFPLPADASTLLWGHTDSTDPIQIEINDGGTYTVPLGVTAPATYTPATPFSRGVLYRVTGSGEDEERELVASITMSTPVGGLSEFAWPSVGIYEFVVASNPPAMEASTGFRRLVRAFGSVAEAQEAPGASDTIRFTIEEEEPECPDPDAEACYSNVLFLPGIESSRLYTDEGKAWEPGLLDDLSDLYLNADGTSARPDVHVKEGDVLDELPLFGKNIYKSFIEDMDALVDAGTITGWSAGAYDWRLSLDDILVSGAQDGEEISYLEATSTPYLIQELRHLAATSKSGKVTIIAHSNGGLLAKRLTDVLGDETSELIDKMILVASPQAGTPMAIAAGMHGYDQAIPGFITSNAVRTFATTSPMFYQLLPSERYFTYVDDPVISFDSGLDGWGERYGNVIHSKERLHEFLVDSYGRVDSKTGDINQPIQLHKTLLDEAQALHDELDIWIPPDGVELIQIAGWGIDSTVSGINYTEEDGALKPNPTFTIDGDGTVVVPSALWGSADTAQDFWVDLNTYNTEHIFRVGPLAINHASILEIEELRSFLRDEIIESTGDLSTYQYITSSAPSSRVRRLRFELHSPLTLDLYDSNGNHTGVSTTTNRVEEGIPGAYYITFGEQQYIFADAETAYQLALEGYDTGTFTLVISEMDGDTTASSITFENVPVTPSTVVSLSVPASIESIAALAVDEDGDGDTDFTVSEDGMLTYMTHIDEVAAADPISNGPPISGSEGGGMVALEFGSVATTSADVVASSLAPDATMATTTTSSPNPEISSTPKYAANSQHKNIKLPLLPSRDAVSPTNVASSSKNAVQVASVAQTPGGSLWSRLYSWIIKKLKRI